MYFIAWILMKIMVFKRVAPKKKIHYDVNDDINIKK